MSVRPPQVRIGSIPVTLDHVDCSVPRYGNGGLSIEIAVRTANPTRAHRAGLLSEYNREGVLSFRVDARGVYGDGQVPTGRFEIERGRAQELYAQFRTEGADYPLDFRGDIDLADGRMGLRGQFLRLYGADRSFEVEIDVPLDVEAIDWTSYVFSDLDEIARAPAGLVQRVILTSPEFETLPAEITALDSLTSLTIENRQAYGVTLPLRDLTPAIGQLQNLEQLAINGAALATLPPDVGHLKALTMLTVGMCELTEVPAGVWSLPNLKHLSFPSNRLTEIPDTVDLPALTSLDLARNQLRALPASLARLPALTRLAIKENPFESLPDALRSIPSLSMTIAERQRLLPVPYPGAEAGYPEEAYRIDRWPERRRQLAAILEHAGPDVDPRMRLFVEQTARPSIGFREAVEPTGERLGGHRFGGMPDLPEGWDYPRYAAEDPDRQLAYEFIAQIDCEALAPMQDYLPRTGILYVFLTTLHDLYGGGNRETVLVKHYDGPREALRPGSRFSLTRDDYFEMVESEYAPMPVVASPEVSLPPSYPLHQNTYLFRDALSAVGGDVDEFIDAYQGVDETDVTERTDHDLGAYGFSQHELPEIEAALAAGGDPADWFTLLTVKSQGGMQWGDAGDLYVLIHKADLARADFSRVEGTMYSS
ncbi:MAG: DUF1963 domain-containing protein [Bacteroidota bacterium]